MDQATLSDNLMASPTNPVNPTRANPTDANLKPYSKYVIQCADFIFWRKPQLKDQEQANLLRL